MAGAVRAHQDHRIDAAATPCHPLACRATTWPGVNEGTMPQLPSLADPRWKMIIRDPASRPPLNFLALKIFLGRIDVNRHQDSSDAALGAAAQQFRDLLEKNISLPSVQKDMTALFGG